MNKSLYSKYDKYTKQYQAELKSVHERDRTGKWDYHGQITRKQCHSNVT